ncbi:MAG TPA: phenylalanine--tRNA ligase subunit alpha [Patescibacteria group bacterium]|uniref:Phenylalanine--tRNA ligase alpha subunit n=1 Tax=Candidatus Woesebacteria bacterium RBG_13_46_13 TaxID=1802479 RepID=A0A1F7X3P4_9BACT|nr:MAG: phenylalanine--tRNA ligase subunit alpha [Candidatus Woesebacteria bacterium RBG_13_46_13]HJX59579.1 phenylalanine--tRNA ligase subunit alpha [Patescibacteria group bacterium]
MQEEVINLKNEALAQIMEVSSFEELETIRVTYLGRSGKFTSLIKRIREVSPEKRKQAGLLVNEAKNTIVKALASQKNHLKESARAWFDPTVPGIKPAMGHLHLVTQAIEEISALFTQLGFVRNRYPEVEWDWYAFETLNMPEGHPARDEWETFFVDAPANPKFGQMVLTPHTSSAQVREMQRVKSPPVRMINIAKCYRRQIDASHVPMFHQFEGLVIDKGISVANLKGTLDYFARNFFGPERKTRLRPFHFQFTEPSFEVDVTCGVCLGRGCKLCKNGWLELGGAGMVHPRVLAAGGINPEKYSGYAFGWGVERTYMMKSGLQIPDIRLIYGSDLRFLKQF